MSPPPTDGADGTDSPAEPSVRVEWDYHHGTVGWLRWLRYAAAGVLGGVFLVVGGSMVLVLGAGLVGAARSILAGAPSGDAFGTLLLFVLLALVGGPVSLLYLLPMLREADQRPTFVPEGFRRGPRLDRRLLAAAAVLGAAALVGAFLVQPVLAGALVVAALVAHLAAMSLSSVGAIDGESQTVTNGAVEHSIARTRAVRRHDLPLVSLVLFRLVPEGGPGALTAPRVLLVPAERADDAWRLLARATETTPDTRESNPTVRLVAGGFGLALLATGVALGVLAGPIGWYAALLLGLFAVLLLAVAVFEG